MSEISIRKNVKFVEKIKRFPITVENIDDASPRTVYHQIIGHLVFYIERLIKIYTYRMKKSDEVAEREIVWISDSITELQEVFSDWKESIDRYLNDADTYKMSLKYSDGTDPTTFDLKVKN